VLKGWALLAALFAGFGAAGWALDGLRGALIFGFCALLLGVGVYWFADRVAMGMVSARELPQGEAPAIHSAVERLSLKAGVPKPRLHVIPDGLPVALSCGRGIAGSSLALSRGLVALPSPAEVEGVLAHEIAHVRHRDVLIQTVAALIAITLVESSRAGGFLAKPLLYVLGPVAASFVHLLLSPKREFEADRLAAELCGTPHGLADALIRIEQAAELLEFHGSPATEPLYTVNPFAAEGLAKLFDTHPPVGERVARLRALDPEWRSKLRAA
jgi:heat shock protein HtpX